MTLPLHSAQNSQSSQHYLPIPNTCFDPDSLRTTCYRNPPPPLMIVAFLSEPTNIHHTFLTNPPEFHHYPKLYPYTAQPNHLLSCTPSLFWTGR